MSEEKEEVWERVFASISGEDIETYREKSALRERINKESRQYEGVDSSKWPRIKFNWDLSVEGRPHSLDAISEADFAKYYPEGFLLGFAHLADIDRILCGYSRRDKGELWGVGFSDKLAYLIVYLSEGRKISPPLVKPLESGEVIFNGGHHRYAIAKELKLNIIPIHVEPQYKDAMDALLDISWENGKNNAQHASCRYNV